MLTVRTVCDEAGNRLLTDDDVDALSKQWAGLVDKLFTVARDLNRLAKDEAGKSAN